MTNFSCIAKERIRKSKAILTGWCRPCKRTVAEPKTPRRRWTTDEDRLLIQFAGKWPHKKFAKRFGRTIPAVRQRLRKLGFSTRVGAESLYSAKELCAWLEVTIDRFRAWVRVGLRRMPGFDKKWLYKPGDLLKFFATRPEAYDYLETPAESIALICTNDYGPNRAWDAIPEPPNWKLVWCRRCEHFALADLYRPRPVCRGCGVVVTRWANAYTDHWPGDFVSSLKDVDLCERFPTHEVAT